MVYRSLGKDVPQAEIWPAIAKVNRLGSLASTTYLMAQDALTRGLAAVAFQARHPIQALRLCRGAGARAILNHRSEPLSPAGHYSVMVDLDAKNVYLHDPFYGPSRSLSHADLLDLWQPKYPNSEIVGGVLIAIAEDPPEIPACPFCHTPTPATIECPNCRKPVGLRPAAVLGCMNENCIARAWNYICCPYCDFMWNSSSHVAPPGARTAVAGDSGAPTSETLSLKPPGLEQMFAALDNFAIEVMKIPGAAEDPRIKEQLDLLPGNKAAIMKAFAEAEMHGRAHTGQLDAFLAASAARAEAHRQKLAELEASKPQPGQPLDGVALGKALLKNLGFTQ
jgi:hypothetical protein